MEMQEESYQRYHIETKRAENIVPHPHRFNVKVNKLKLATFLLKELIHYKGNLEVVSSRPCIYGVFSGPIGGFAPRDHLCVGCLRCTTQYPEMVQILRNNAYSQMGDDYFKYGYVENIVHEAESGRIPIKGQGYRGTFGGDGWDGMWTDMSEIVRPTRDGIHGREFISTGVDIGSKPPYLKFDSQKQPVGEVPHMTSIPIPMLFDALPQNLLCRETCLILSESARQMGTFTVLPLDVIQRFSLKGCHIIPLLNKEDINKNIGFEPKILELEGGGIEAFHQLRTAYPRTILLLRSAFETVDPLQYYREGVRNFHFTANYHGKSKNGTFIKDLIHDVHRLFVEEGCREEVTLMGSGGLVAAEHVPKAIICGLDAVALDTPLIVALQGKFFGSCMARESSLFELPRSMTQKWGVQRLKNLTAAWRDQLLEILGAMGLREVRRLRGEIGRAMFQKDLENEAFTGIEGYDIQ